MIVNSEVKHVMFHSYVIFDKRLSVDHFKIEDVQSWSIPRTMTEICSFYGLASFYRRFVNYFSNIIPPLTNCTKENAFNWTPEANEAFEFIKGKLTTTPILVLSRTFILHLNFIVIHQNYKLVWS